MYQTLALAGQYSMGWVHLGLVIHLLKEQLGCFQFGVITDKATVNIHVQV